MPEMIESTDDRRVANTPMRHQYRILTEDEKEQMARIKDVGQTFLDYVNSLSCANTREIALAKTKLEEAVMWAVKGLTG